MRSKMILVGGRWIDDWRVEKGNGCHDNACSSLCTMRYVGRACAPFSRTLD